MLLALLEELGISQVEPFFEGAGVILMSSLIGVLLMGFAVALAIENKRLILGESLSADVERRLRTAVASHDGVVHIDDFRTMFIGTGKVLVTADVSFDPELVTGDIDEDVQQIEQTLVGIDDRVKLVYIEPEL
jgi:divalent metal cation (Fe/Co/Zn/Cd) transporter